MCHASDWKRERERERNRESEGSMKILESYKFGIEFLFAYTCLVLTIENFKTNKLSESIFYKITPLSVAFNADAHKTAREWNFKIV